MAPGFNLIRIFGNCAHLWKPTWGRELILPGDAGRSWVLLNPAHFAIFRCACFASHCGFSVAQHLISRDEVPLRGQCIATPVVAQCLKLTSFLTFPDSILSNARTTPLDCLWPFVARYSSSIQQPQTDLDPDPATPPSLRRLGSLIGNFTRYAPSDFPSSYDCTPYPY